MSISPVVRRAERFQDLLAIPGGDGPYLFTRMFRESDRRERRQSRRHFKLLKRVDGTIREIVTSGETVLVLTDGRGFSFWERWVLGWRRAVVLTDRRVIFLQLDAARRPRVLHRELAYSAIAGIEQGPWGKVEIRLHSGETLEVQGVRRADRPVLLDQLKTCAKAHRHGKEAPALKNLCPYCHRGIPGRPGSCPHCLRRFRRSWKSALSSLLTPGLGSYLLGYRGFAVLEFLMAVAVWAAYLFAAEPWGLPGVGSAVGPEWIFAGVHGTTAGLTWFTSRNGVFPSGSA